MKRKSDIEDHLEEAFALHERGKGYGDIREHFSREGLSDELTGYLIRLLDDFVVEEEKISSRLRTARNMVVYGVLVLLVGMLIAYLFWSNGSLQGLYLALGLTPVAVGLAAIWTGYRKMLYWKNHRPEIDDAKLKLKRRFG